MATTLPRGAFLLVLNQKTGPSLSMKAYSASNSPTRWIGLDRDRPAAGRGRGYLASVPFSRVKIRYLPSSVTVGSARHSLCSGSSQTSASSVWGVPRR